jgi:ApbE superfamily uncharacterized protein (UPF0280 family)
MESVNDAARNYRRTANPSGLVPFHAAVNQTDLWIAAERDLTGETILSIRANRLELERYISTHPAFLSALAPWTEPVPEGSIVEKMVTAAAAAGIGPMSAVAGALAEAVAHDLSEYSPRILVENGGDLFLSGTGRTRVGLWAGPSPITGKLCLALDAGSGLAVCTSSGTVGPSLSFGRADCATVISPSGALADAAATELGNRVAAPGDIEDALDWVLSVDGVLGAVAVMEGAFGAKGEVELVPVK